MKSKSVKATKQYFPVALFIKPVSKTSQYRTYFLQFLGWKTLMWQTTKTLKKRFILLIDNDYKAVEISLSPLTLIFFIISSSITILYK